MEANLKTQTIFKMVMFLTFCLLYFNGSVFATIGDTSKQTEKILKLICYGTGPRGNIPGRFETIDQSRKKLKINGFCLIACI